jgi:hypothetical protein
MDPNYLDKQGRVKTWPSRQHKRLQREVLEYLAAKFEKGRHYSEREVNALLNRHHTFGDPALLRRELIEAGLLVRKRDGSAYWLPEESS